MNTDLHPCRREDLFDLQALQWAESATSALSSISARKTPDFMPALPERIFCQVAALPGKALAVFLVIVRRSRMKRSPTFSLSTSFLVRFGLSRREKAGALQHLEKAGLITVERMPRRNPVVTLLGTWHVQGHTARGNEDGTGGVATIPLAALPRRGAGQGRKDRP
jgi:hypothetical protein